MESYSKLYDEDGNEVELRCDACGGGIHIVSISRGLALLNCKKCDENFEELQDEKNTALDDAAGYEQQAYDMEKALRNIRDTADELL